MSEIFLYLSQSLHTCSSPWVDRSAGQKFHRQLVPFPQAGVPQCGSEETSSLDYQIGN